MKSLGYMLLDGLGVSKDLETSRYWCTRAAKEGNNRRAMFNLGVICSTKFPDPDAMIEAFQWY